MAKVQDNNNNNNNDGGGGGGKLPSTGDTKDEAYSLDELSASLEKRTDVTDKDLDYLMKIFANINCTTVWSKVKRDDFTVRRFEFGYVADICGCELTSDAMKRFGLKPDDDDDCVGVVVKRRNTNLDKMHDLEDGWINTNTILVAMAQKGLTPRLVYIDSECMVQEYIPSRAYSYEDDEEPETVKQLARILAQTHCLRLPLSNGCSTIWRFLENYETSFQTNAYTTNHLEYLKQDKQERIDKYYDLLAQIEFKETFLFTMSLIRMINSPVIMSQGDFNRTNRLVKETPHINKDGSVSIEKKIYLVDLDNSGYVPRGMDLGGYYSNYKSKDQLFGSGEFPTDEEMKIFLGEYRAECIRQQGDQFERDPRNSMEHLILETKAFILSIYRMTLMFALMMYKPDSEKADYFLSVAVDAEKGYHKLRRRFTDDGSIERILQQ